jgi:hypothetical protein
VGGVVVVDVSKEIELVPRRHFGSALALIPTRGTNPRSLDRGLARHGMGAGALGFGLWSLREAAKTLAANELHFRLGEVAAAGDTAAYYCTAAGFPLSDDDGLISLSFPFAK